MSQSGSGVRGAVFRTSPKSNATNDNNSNDSNSRAVKRIYSINTNDSYDTPIISTNTNTSSSLLPITSSNGGANTNTTNISPQRNNSIMKQSLFNNYNKSSPTNYNSPSKSNGNSSSNNNILQSKTIQYLLRIIGLLIIFIFVSLSIYSSMHVVPVTTVTSSSVLKSSFIDPNQQEDLLLSNILTTQPGSTIIRQDMATGTSTTTTTETDTTTTSTGTSTTADTITGSTSISGSDTEISNPGIEGKIKNDSTLGILENEKDNDNDISMDRTEYYKSFNDGLSIGILSKQKQSFFTKIQNEIDTDNNIQRCIRYGGTYNINNPTNRRIFFGALIANEPWEVFEIVASEVYKIYSGIVFVEGNRTQNFTPRHYQRLHHLSTMKLLYGTNNIQIRQFIQEDPLLLDLNREHEQRAQIIIGWKELGMISDDVGIIADSDETFTRDYLRAIQVCDNIELLEYNTHKCHHNKVKLTATTQVFESTPECISQQHGVGREWFHPDLIIGHCIEGINLSGDHPIAPRITTEQYPFIRANGFGDDCSNWTLDDSTNTYNNNNHTLWNAADYRRACGGYMVRTKYNSPIPDYMKQYIPVIHKNQSTNNGILQSIFPSKYSVLDKYTGYHFHNFFSQFKSTRFKYLTYGHPDPNANSKPIEQMSNDLRMMYRCVKNLSHESDMVWNHLIGGYNELQPFYPIYFIDADYRYRRHEHVKQMIDEDEELLKEQLLNTQQQQQSQQQTQETVLDVSNEIRMTAAATEYVIDNTVKDISMDRTEYYTNFNDGLSIGILSKEKTSYYRSIQYSIDNYDNNQRCERYGGYYNSTHPNNRRIYYGALVASEPWEVFEIIGTEVYNIYSGIVLVEGNRTQNYTPRKFQRIQHTDTIKLLYGTTNVQIRQFIQEDPLLLDLNREHEQRAQIIVGWKELGMTSDDIGILSDSDETFTRDFLRAMQVCDGIDILEYNIHKCHHSLVKLTSSTQVFESTPECITDQRTWHHPDLIIGHCIEGISNSTTNPIAPRKGKHYPFEREDGYGGNCYDWYNDDYNTTNKIIDNDGGFTLWNAADFRRTCGGYMKYMSSKQQYTLNGQILSNTIGYHFHNFFSQFKSTRFKYATYGHPDPDIAFKPIANMSFDLEMMYKCVKDIIPTSNQKWKHIVGGYTVLQPFYPIYFYDNDYRNRRHEHVKQMIQEDEELLKEKLLEMNK